MPQDQGGPSKLLRKLSRQLFRQSTEQARFLQALLSPQPLHPCILWTRPPPSVFPFAREPRLDWQPPWVDRLALGEKPGRHDLHGAGYYYCLDFSSIFAISTLLHLPQPMDRVVDVCAAPGGKSVFAWVALTPQQLLCNEVIGKRQGPLIGNLKRCGVTRAIALGLDPQKLASLIPGTAQVVIVDAPCSGQSLLAKGSQVPGCFHPVTMNKNANRQKRILANSAQIVAPQGYLAYMTCTYAPAENEQVCEWFLSRFPDFQPAVVPHLAPFQSHLTALPCYRLWPDQGLGAGGFTALFQNQTVGDASPLPIAFWEHPCLKVNLSSQ